VRASRIAERQVPQGQVAIEHCRALHLVPVVILSVDPEHRDSRHLLLAAEAFRQPDRVQRLEQREQRSAKQPRLLPGDDRHRVPVAELGGSRPRFRRGVAALLLRLQQVGDRVARALVALRPLDGVAPCRRVSGVAGEELGQRRIVVRVVHRQAVDPGESPDVDGKARGRAGQSRLREHRRLLSQSGTATVKATGEQGVTH
jgi:hypothetical protein